MLPVPDQGGHVRGQAHQRRDGVGGLVFGPGLQILSKGDHGDEHAGGFEIEVHGPGRRVHAEKDLDEVPQAVQKGRARAHGHKRVHVRAAAQKARDAHQVETASGPHDGHDQDELGQGESGRGVVGVDHGRQGQAQHVSHGHVEQKSGQDQGRRELPAQAQQVFLGFFAFCSKKVGGPQGFGTEAEVADGPSDIPDRRPLRVEGEFSGLGGQIHRGPKDPREGPDRPLDARGAGRAVHAGDGQLQGGLGLRRPGREPEIGHPPDDRVEVHGGGIKGQLHGFVGQVDRDPLHPGERGQGFFDASGAGRAMHARDRHGHAFAVGMR
jgi:hypothetical protein